jgi:hypothetical protein
MDANERESKGGFEGDRWQEDFKTGKLKTRK